MTNEMPKGMKDLSDITPDRKKRKSSQPSKQELRDKVQKLEATQTPSLDEKAIGLMTSGLLAILEGTTKMPFRQAEPDLKKGVDESLVVVLQQYGGETVQKYGPIVQLATCASLLTLDVMNKKRKPIKKETDTPIKQFDVRIDDVETEFMNKP